MSVLLDAPDDLFGDGLREFYEVVNPDGVAAFLGRYPATRRLLLDAGAALRRQFGERAAVSLEFLASPEAEDGPQLYVGIDTSSMDYHTARNAVREFRAAFLADRPRDQYRNLVFSPV